VNRRIALVSTGDHAHLDDDLPPIVECLAARGVDAPIVDWHDDSFDFRTVELAILRSPWDYTWQLDAFLAWAERTASRTILANPLPVVRWNTDKRYLLDLAARGVPVVDTQVVDPGDAPRLDPAVEVVVKPVVSAGGRDTERYAPDAHDDARAHVERLHAQGRSVLIQPYLPAIDEAGETGLVFVGDTFSHAFRKGAILRPGVAFVEGLYREEEIGPREASAAELAVAEAALDAVAGCLPGSSRRDLLYARVDLVPDGDRQLVLELELVEPSLFCATAPGAADRAAAAFAAALPPR
jgi:glutathione synthase/RimK-type ligase-like ATP-grasp enzyme